MDDEALYREIVETTLDGIWVIDLDGRTIYANAAVAALYGVSQDAAQRLSVFDTLDDHGRAHFAEHLRVVRSGQGNREEVETLFVAQDGTRTWILVRETLLYDDAGQVRAILHRISDYDARRKFVDRLIESQTRLHQAQEIAKLGRWTWDVAADKVSVLEVGPDLVGPERDVPRTTYAGFIATLHPEDRERVSAEVSAALEHADSFQFDARVERDDGCAWIRARALVARDADGRVVSVSGTQQDVTSLKEVELALRDEVAQNQLMRSMTSAANQAQSFHEVLLQARELLLGHDDWERAVAFLHDDEGSPHAPRRRRRPDPDAGRGRPGR